MTHYRIIFLIIAGILTLFFYCSGHFDNKTQNQTVLIEAESFTASQGNCVKQVNPEGGKSVNLRVGTGWLAYEVRIPAAGRYRCEIQAIPSGDKPAVLWVEDYYDNRDGRTYNITGDIQLTSDTEPNVSRLFSKDGCPLDTGIHKIKLHFAGNGCSVDWIKFTPLKMHRITPTTLIQNTVGDEWKIVWADEFEGEGLPDTTKWTFDLGDWGWGNNELQYYTENRTENARQENDHLIIEARKNALDYAWTSARLTTRGKISFVYGKIEFKAKVPSGDGMWAAGWLLGDAYRDEISWPYCGEIDVLECVGREIDDQSGDGINHTSCHTRAYYFKQGNQISSTIEVKNIRDEFHLYSIEWDSSGIYGMVDGEKYFTYNKLNGEWEWPFNNPQNLIINLAVGGGMGGTVDENLTSQQLIVDYIRVYAKQ
jgi:beta-glucanase (GH16 family)